MRSRIGMLWILLLGGWLLSMVAGCRSGEDNQPTTTLVGNAPDSLTATRNSAGNVITLQWRDHTNNEEGFRVERSTAGSLSGFRLVGTTAPNAVTYQDAPTPFDSICYYRVYAFGYNSRTNYSSIITVPRNVVNAPSNFTATRDDTTNHVNLHWTDNAQFETGYRIERATSSYDTAFRLLQLLPPNTIAAVDTNTSLDTVYYYRACTVNGTLTSSYTPIASVPIMMINAPTGLTVSRGSMSIALITWQDNSNNETGFRVERSLTSPDTGYQFIGSTAAFVASFVDSTAPFDRNGYYRVYAVQYARRSGNSNVAILPHVIVSPPSYVAATRTNHRTAQLSWYDVQTNALAFRIQRSTTSATTNFITIASFPSTQVAYNDTSARNDAVYYYRMYSICGELTSSASNVASSPIPTVPAPTYLTGTRNTNGTSIALQWRDNASDETGYQIERSTTSTTTGFQVLTTVSANTTEWTDPTVPRDTICYYRVAAVFTYLHSSYSNVCTVPIFYFDLRQPGNFNAHRTGIDSTTLYWMDTSTGETGYIIERSTNDIVYTVIATLPANSGTYIDRTSSSDTTYWYKVKSYYGANASPTALVNVLRNLAPYTPSGLMPANGATGVPLIANLQWSGGTDPEADTVRFNVYLIDPETFPATVLLIAERLLTRQCYTPQLQPNHTYRWQVLSTDRFHSIPAINPALGMTFTTTASGAIDWLEIPGSGTIRMPGRGSYHGYQDYPTPVNYDSSYNDTLTLDVSTLFRTIGQTHFLAYRDSVYAAFPLVPRADTLPGASLYGLAEILSNGHINGGGWQRTTILPATMKVGGNTINGICVKMQYDNSALYARYSARLQLYVAPGYGITGCELWYDSMFGNHSATGFTHIYTSYARP